MASIFSSQSQKSDNSILPVISRFSSGELKFEILLIDSIYIDM